MTETKIGNKYWLPKSELRQLIERLSSQGYRVLGPTIDQEAIVYAEIRSVDEHPQGWTDRQQPGSYRLERRDDDAVFGYAVGPHSWKRYLFPARAIVGRSERTQEGWTFREP